MPDDDDLVEEPWPEPAAAEGADVDCWSPAVPAAIAAQGFIVGAARPANTAFRPRREVSAPPIEPWICPPVRLSDCPVCNAQPGIRCAGFERFDECHFERFLRCAQQSIGAS